MSDSGIPDLHEAEQCHVHPQMGALYQSLHLFVRKLVSRLINANGTAQHLISANVMLCLRCKQPFLGWKSSCRASCTSYCNQRPPSFIPGPLHCRMLATWTSPALLSLAALQKAGGRRLGPRLLDQNLSQAKALLAGQKQRMDHPLEALQPSLDQQKPQEAPRYQASRRHAAFHLFV